jgi:hypothetical protein
MKRIFFLPILGVVVYSSYSFSQEIIAEIRNVSPTAITSEGFRLNRDQEIEIEAVGFRPKRSGRLFTHAWILDSQTREMVWDLEDAATERRSRTLVEYQDSVRLAKGDYEIYFSTYPFKMDHSDGWGNFLERVFNDVFNKEDGEIHREIRSEMKSLSLVVTGEGERYRENRVSELQEGFKDDALVSWTAVRNEERLQQGFTLERPMEVQIYALGEIRENETFDYGWIMNSQTREKVWKMAYRGSDHAGGALKNRVVSDVIHLAAGQYVASFVTDDSHSYDHWNQSPPYDPAFWGMTIKAANPSMIRYVETYEYDDRAPQNVIVELTRLRDNEFQTEGFTLNRNLDLHIYALGEGRDNKMFDYGWVVDAKTRNKIWEMDFHHTDHAGGADKNRMFDGVVPFGKGSYLVYYVTDGSHSYWDWNSTAPHDREAWGITISAADRRLDPHDISSYEPERDQSILAQITKIGNHERERSKFTLDDDSDVRIYAIGEGRDGRMYDYGWIEEANGRRVVWEMTYRMTEHAGGGMKNRLYHDQVFLKRGEYVVYYETDDSHSFEEWNSKPPSDPVNWGITLYLEER